MRFSCLLSRWKWR